jgi:hypothetical protein
MNTTTSSNRFALRSGTANFLRLVLPAIVALVASSFRVDASVIMTLTDNQSGSVTLSYSGYVNTSFLISTGGSLTTNDSIQPSSGLITKASSVSLFVTGSSDGATNFGSGGVINPTSSSGSPIYINFGAPSLLGLPVGYTSGSTISGSMTFSGSFASLGITSGTQAITWSGGGDGKSVTLTRSISSSGNVPEPTSMAIFSIGSLGLAYYAGRKPKY